MVLDFCLLLVLKTYWYILVDWVHSKQYNLGTRLISLRLIIREVGIERETRTYLKENAILKKD